MAIVNRDLDSSQQLYVVQNSFGAVVTGVSAYVGAVPSIGQVLEWRFTGKGVSNAPVYQLSISRWTSAGVTNIALGSAVTLAGAFGLSGGVIGATFNAGSYAVQIGDLLCVNAAGANTAVTDLVVAVVIKATADIKKTFSSP